MAIPNLLLALAVATLVDATTGSAQTLRNASFETGGETEDVAAGWQRWGHWLNRETGWSPTHGGHCLLGYHHWEVPNAEDSGAYQDVTKPSARQTATFHIYANVDRAKDGKKDARFVELRMEATIDGQQRTLASRLFSVDQLKADTWEKLSVTGTTLNDTLRVLVIVSPHPDDKARGGALRFDDASLDVVK